MRLLGLAALAALVLASPPPRRTAPLRPGSLRDAAPPLGPSASAALPAAPPAAPLLPWIRPGSSFPSCQYRLTERACGTKLYCIMFPVRWYAAISFPHRDAAECLAAREPPPAPRVVYRGDPRGPAELRRLRGIPPKPHGPLGNESFSLQAHHLDRRRFADAYVSTSGSFGCALGYVCKKSGYVYRVHATPNMVDLEASAVMLRFAVEEEFSALGGVRWDQVEAWIHIASRDAFAKLDLEQVHAYAKPDAFLAQHPEYQWFDNDEYNATRFDALAAGPGEPRLAGNRAAAAKYPQKTLEQWAVDFMDRNGAAVGWKGKFPLDQPVSPAWGVTEGGVPPGGFPLGSEPVPKVVPPEEARDEHEDPGPNDNDNAKTWANKTGSITPKRP